MANDVPVPRAHPSVARIAPVVVHVPEARVSDPRKIAARSWGLFGRVIVQRNPSARPKEVPAHPRPDDGDHGFAYDERGV